jgi:hypothetical protein
MFAGNTGVAQRAMFCKVDLVTELYEPAGFSFGSRPRRVSAAISSLALPLKVELGGPPDFVTSLRNAVLTIFAGEGRD